MQEITKTIILKCQDGCAESFSVLVGNYERAIYSFVFKMLFKTPKAYYIEDAVQEIFLKVYNQIGSFNSMNGAHFSSWLFTVARNHCVSILRKNPGDNKKVSIEDMESFDVPDKNAALPSDSAWENELAEKTAEAIAALPDDQKSAFILRYYEELPYEEIAKILGENSGTVKSRIFRAREALQISLKDYL